MPYVITTHNGVLLPSGLQSANVETRDAYAAEAKASNAAFVAAYWAAIDAGMIDPDSEVDPCLM
jgi:hypothetical protein